MDLRPTRVSQILPKGLTCKLFCKSGFITKAEQRLDKRSDINVIAQEIKHCVVGLSYSLLDSCQIGSYCYKIDLFSENWTETWPCRGRGELL